MPIKRMGVPLGKAALALAVLLTFGTMETGVAQAQPADFQMTWFSVDGGGGVSEGGGYALRGAIGQADAGTLTGGGFVLSGGFLVGGGATSGPEPDGHSLFLPQLRRVP